MNSFIDWTADYVWSDGDITRRTEAMVRAEISEPDETILNRKLQGAALGAYTLTSEDQAAIQRFNAVVMAASMAGVEARADMALLAQAMAVEAAQAQLQVAPDDEQAQAVVDAATPEVLALVAARAAARAEPPEEPAP